MNRFCWLEEIFNEGKALLRDKNGNEYIPSMILGVDFFSIDEVRYQSILKEIDNFLNHINRKDLKINKSFLIDKAEFLYNQLVKLNPLVKAWTDKIGEPRNVCHLDDMTISSFLNGNHSIAVLEAFRLVEDSVRQKGRYADDLVGVALMRVAFDKENGQLRNNTLPVGEREAMAHLFAGAIGFIKNPKSHLPVQTSSEKAVELLHFANYLMRLLKGEFSERRG